MLRLVVEQAQLASDDTKYYLDEHGASWTRQATARHTMDVLDVAWGDTTEFGVLFDR